MDKNLVTEFEGSLTAEDVLDALLASGLNKAGVKTFSELYECLMGCSHCPFEEKCDKLAASLEERGYSPYCNELLDIMLGNKHISDFV